MNREDIIRMARGVGLADAEGVVHAFYQLERFAALVASAEREACAKLCDRYTDSCSDHEAGTAMNIQDAIRARGQA